MPHRFSAAALRFGTALWLFAACAHAPAASEPRPTTPAQATPPPAATSTTSGDAGASAQMTPEEGIGSPFREMAGLPPRPPPKPLPPEPGPGDIQFGTCDPHKFTIQDDYPRAEGDKTPRRDRSGKRIPEPPPVLVSYGRGPCYGTCPDYDVVLHVNGTMKYQGNQCVQARGLCTATLSAAQMDRVIALLREAHLAGNVEDFQPITDLPRNGMWVGPPAADPPAIVSWNAYGNRYDQLLAALDRLLGLHRWVGDPPQGPDYRCAQ